MEKQTRRSLLKSAATAAVAVTGGAALMPEAKAQSGILWEKKAIHHPPAPAPAAQPAAPAAPAAPKAPPLFNSIVQFGNLIFLAGIGAHFAGTIEEHTKHVLDEMEQNLILAGSSMAKVLKVTVYLSDLANYTKMNSVYAGRWGDVPPVRTTVAVAGLPGDSLVEIDCIASV
jgi:2-iminobutanoate/2-iminopropanoate deaminase